ncbi:MAG: ATP-binding protein, partial [Gammaproteobacteria bacterium]
MTEELEQLLHNLRLYTVAERFDAHLTQAEADGLPVAKLLATLLRDEWHARQEQALKRRLQRARLPEIWTIESFPFKQQTGVDRRRIRTLAELDFVPKAENIVFIGPTGVGKTGLASGLLLKALQNGYRGLFVRAQDLFDEMYASLADR